MIALQSIVVAGLINCWQVAVDHKADISIRAANYTDETAWTDFSL